MSATGPRGKSPRLWVFSARYDLARFECIQPMYSLVKRQAEVEILPLAASEGLGVISYSPLGSGLLSGRYSPGMQAERGRLMENQMQDSATACRSISMSLSLRRLRTGARLAPRDAGRGMGHGEPGAHRADRRRAESGTVGGVVAGRGGGDDAGVAGRDPGTSCGPRRRNRSERGTIGDPVRRGKGEGIVPVRPAS